MIVGLARLPIHALCEERVELALERWVLFYGIMKSLNQ